MRELTRFVVALFFGILGAVFALAFQWLAVLLAGFLGGGYFLMNIFYLATEQVQSPWFLFCIGGLIGIFVMIIAFDWALIAISSLVGAMLIVQHLNIDESIRSMVFIGCTVLGVLAQSLSLEPSRLNK